MHRKIIFLHFLLIFVAMTGQAQANLLTNGNFNTGDFSGWWIWVAEPENTSAEVQSTYNYDGTYNAKLSSWNTAWPADGPVAFGQTFDLCGDLTYSLSFVYSTEWTSWGTADYLIKYYDSSWAQIGWEWDTLFYQEAGPTDWVPVYLEFTTPAGTAHVDVQFRAYDWAADVFFDDVYVQGNIEVDIRPETCPNPLALKGRGILTVAILGDLDLDVTDIDAASVELGGAPVIRSKYQDVGSPAEGDCPGGPDGIDDLVLKFDRGDIVAGLGAVHHGDEVSLVLTGNLLTGECIAGADSVVIVGKADPAQRPPKKEK